MIYMAIGAALFFSPIIFAAAKYGGDICEAVVRLRSEIPFPQWVRLVAAVRFGGVLFFYGAFRCFAVWWLDPAHLVNLIRPPLHEAGALVEIVRPVIGAPAIVFLDMGKGALNPVRAPEPRLVRHG